MIREKRFFVEQHMQAPPLCCASLAGGRVRQVLSLLQGGSAWLPWQPLQGCWRGGQVPATAGLYRVAALAADRKEVVYIGESDRLRVRLGMLRGVFERKHMPYRSPHTAGPGLWSLLDRDPATHFEVSVAPLEDIPERWRKGFESVAIALHRQQHGASPSVNFSRMPSGYRASSYNTARLAQQRRRYRGGRTDQRDKSHLPGIAPRASFGTVSPAEKTWGGHAWSAWQLAHERIPYQGRGLYRVGVPDQHGLVYLGWGKVQEGVRRQLGRVAPAAALQCSWVEEDRYDHQFQELQTDLIAGYLTVTTHLPCCQFQRQGSLALCPDCPLWREKLCSRHEEMTLPHLLPSGLIVLAAESSKRIPIG